MPRTFCDCRRTPQDCFAGNCKKYPLPGSATCAGHAPKVEKDTKDDGDYRTTLIQRTIEEPRIHWHEPSEADRTKGRHGWRRGVRGQLPPGTVGTRRMRKTQLPCFARTNPTCSAVFRGVEQDRRHLGVRASVFWDRRGWGGRGARGWNQRGENHIDQQKIERIVKGVAKSQRQEVRRALDKERMASHERATKDLCVIPKMSVLDRSNG